MLIEKERGRGAILAVTTVLFLFLAIAAMRQSQILSLIDSELISHVHHDSTALTGVFKLITTLASPTLDLLYMIIIAGLLWGFKYKIPALWAIGYGFGGNVLGTIIKKIVARQRPVGHMASDDGYSFPSGHVLGTFMVAAILFLVVLPLMQNNLQRLLIQTILCLWVLLVMFSRVYLQAHYATDTIGAVLLAYAWLQGAEYLYVWLAPKLKQVKFLSNSRGVED
ncbi:phosphoesterase PA-phosphatase related [Furfurilactobacillus rossiae]|uniref:phosphatase PAP2 family protein n=1 Tax=Furfurilactobacillus rossiae TaxID=231049 RepID=UPI0015C19E63|nr:phosphatase PAP2 family protein [Furfurilactobacillus rossiae]MCF6164532.1 phosphatase PAP2 family protein [Furfurilactobacillus rossiae]QLE64815.1 phosphoesterase PA-phosphatase related [Furfurilactobacillus rossiae]